MPIPVVPLVRAARPADCEILTRFNVALALESEHQVLKESVVGRGVRALLNDPAKGRYWVAEVDGTVTGQLLVTYEWSDWRNGWMWWVQSVYVEPTHRRQGLFTTLLDFARQQALQNEEVRGLRLYVEENNGPAIATYLKRGFVQTHYRILESLLRSAAR